jgi:hypothetical protein
MIARAKINREKVGMIMSIPGFLLFGWLKTKTAAIFQEM